jgi:hypothetical protein
MKEPFATFERAWEEAKLKQEANAAAWGDAWLRGRDSRWNADLDRGEIRFTNADGFVAIADVQAVGSYNRDEGTWLWSWGNRTVSTGLTFPAQLARQFGERHGLADYTTALVHCHEDEAKRFTALALHLCEGAGTYSGPYGPEGDAYLTYGKVTVFPGR